MADKERVEELLQLIENAKSKMQRMLYIAALRELLRSVLESEE